MIGSLPWVLGAFILLLTYLSLGARHGVPARDDILLHIAIGGFIGQVWFPRLFFLADELASMWVWTLFASLCWLALVAVALQLIIRGRWVEVREANFAAMARKWPCVLVGGVWAALLTHLLLSTYWVPASGWDVLTYWAPTVVELLSDSDGNPLTVNPARHFDTVPLMIKWSIKTTPLPFAWKLPSIFNLVSYMLLFIWFARHLEIPVNAMMICSLVSIAPLIENHILQPGYLDTYVGCGLVASVLLFASNTRNHHKYWFLLLVALTVASLMVIKAASIVYVAALALGGFAYLAIATRWQSTTKLIWIGSASAVVAVLMLLLTETLPQILYVDPSRNIYRIAGWHLRSATIGETAIFVSLLYALFHNLSFGVLPAVFFILAISVLSSPIARGSWSRLAFSRLPTYVVIAGMLTIYLGMHSEYMLKYSLVGFDTLLSRTLIPIFMLIPFAILSFSCCLAQGYVPERKTARVAIK